MNKLTVQMRRTEATLGLLYIALQVLILPIALVAANAALPKPFSAAALNFISFAINFICVTVIFHQYLIASLKVFVRHSRRALTICLIGFFLYCLSTILVNVLVISLDPDFSNVNDENIAALTGENSFLITFGTVVLVPIVEETLYRGVVFGQLHQKNPVIAYIVSTAVFASLHVLGYIGLYDPVRLLLCFVQYIPAGIILAWTYIKADTIWAPVLIHMAVNLIGMSAIQ